MVSGTMFHHDAWLAPRSTTMHEKPIRSPINIDDRDDFVWPGHVVIPRDAGTHQARKHDRLDKITITNPVEPIT